MNKKGSSRYAKCSEIDRGAPSSRPVSSPALSLSPHLLRYAGVARNVFDSPWIADKARRRINQYVGRQRPASLETKDGSSTYTADGYSDGGIELINTDITEDDQTVQAAETGDSEAKDDLSAHSDGSNGTE